MADTRSVRGFSAQVLPAVGYGLCIFVGGSLPQGPDPGLDFEYQDKVIHFIAFGLFVVLLRRALRYLRPEWSAVQQLRSAALLSSLLGALLEVWQSFLPTRSAEGLDLLADVLGALAVAFLLWRLQSPRASLGRRA